MPLKTGRPRLVVLGTGWAGARLLKDIDPKLYDITVISKRNHMVFTPLLASTTVGTLQTRDVAINVTDIQKALFEPQNAVYIADAKAIHTTTKVVECASEDGITFNVAYDKLAVCTGALGSTFGIKGVHEYTHFLRDVGHAEAIRTRLMENIAKAGIPGRPLVIDDTVKGADGAPIMDWQRLLHIVIVGGGPTGVEVAGELCDFIAQDLKRLYPDRARAMKITIIEALQILGPFNPELREYAARKLTKQGVIIRKGVVKEVRPSEIMLTDGCIIPFGLCIWSTGVGPTPFTKSLPFAMTSTGRISIDDFLRVLAHKKADATGTPIEPPSAPKPTLLTQDTKVTDVNLEVVPDVFSMGDCAANGKGPLPPVAQVAEQQGKYLAKLLNAMAKNPDYLKTAQPFKYVHLGSMASVGNWDALLQLGGGMGLPFNHIKGFIGWFSWRSAYLTRLGSVQKRISVAFSWTLTMVFGRDMSRW